MTLAECVKSGKKYKRPIHACWYTPEIDIHCQIRIEDALADDWEIMQKETFTRADVERAVGAAMSGLISHNIPGRAWEEAMKAAEGEA